MLTLPARTHSHRWLLPALLVTIVLCAYLLSRSASLDDFDSYSFVLALDTFDIQLQQPQPPGFPVYVAAGRLLNTFLADPRIALTTLSAISGALAAAALGWLAQLLYRRTEITLAVIAIFALQPIQWLTSAKALSDGPGLALAIGAIATLWAARTDHRWLLPGTALLGFSLGMRPQTNLPGLLLLAWLLWNLLRARHWRLFATAGLILAGTIALWLLPTLISTGGLTSYRALLDAHSDHVWQNDSLFGAQITAATLTARFKDFFETYLVPTLGISVYAPLSLANAVQVGVLTVLIIGGLLLADYRRTENKVVLMWLILVLLPYFLLTSLNRPRLMLPLLPPLILLLVAGWSRILIYPLARYTLWGAITAGLLLQAVPLVSTLADEPAPPAQAAAYIRTHYPAESTLVAAAGSYRAAQVELPGYDLLYRYRFDPAAAQEAMSSGRYQAIAVLDRDDFGDVIDILDAGGRYVPIEDLLFQRDERVHWQHSLVRLQILLPSDRLTAAMLQPFSDDRINIADAQAARFLGHGWFRPEMPGGVAARWAGDNLSSTLRVALDQQGTYNLRFLAAAFPEAQTVTVYINGQEAARFDLVADWREYYLLIDPMLIAGHSISTITLEHSRAESPFERSRGSSSDRRQLTAAYAWFQFIPQ